MRIKVTRSEAITALQQGKCVWFGAANRPMEASGYEVGPRTRKSRRRCAKWPNMFRWQYPKGTKWAWWIDG